MGIKREEEGNCFGWWSVLNYHFEEKKFLYFGGIGEIENLLALLLITLHAL